MSVTPENHLVINLRLFDLPHEVKAPIGNFENVLLNDIFLEALVRDVRRAFNVSLKQLETDIKNFKENPQV